MTNLEQHIQDTPLHDTHEHLKKEHEFVETGPDILQDLFGNYVRADLVVAGASENDVEELLNGSDNDVAGRFAAIQNAWQHCMHTGYGEAVRLIARKAYGLDEITSESLENAREQNKMMRRPGERIRILKDVANLDHVQIDDFCLPCVPDESGPDFFLYDLSWRKFCVGELDATALYEETRIEVTDLATLREAMAALFTKYAPCAIAVKTQHAYNRTLRWQQREDADAERVLAKRLSGNDVTQDEALCLGDWGWSRGVELAIEHNLPFKIHTGYYAGHGRMPTDYIRGGNLCPLLAAYPTARFVLMHISYPYNDELVALAKHYPNVYADLCWAWSVDPYSSCDFVRQMIHAVPSNKLFAFGGDTMWPNSALAYSIQSRQWLARALKGEVDDCLLSEAEAIKLATRLMATNQEECFDLTGTRTAITETLSVATA